MKLNFKWKRPTTEYSTGERLYLNKILVGAYYWRTMPNSPNWQGKITLPSLRESEIESNDESEIKSKIENVVTVWFTEALKDGE